MGLLDSIASSLSGGQGSAPPQQLSGVNSYNQFPSSNNGQPDAPQPQAPAAPPSAPPSGGGNPPPQQPQQQMGPQLQGIKGYLSNIFYNMGEAAKAHLGMKTDQEVQLEQQKINIQKQQADATTFEKQSEAQWRQQQTAQNAQGPVVDQQEADSLGVPVGSMLSPAQKFAIYKSKADMAGKANVAQIGANARLGAAQITALSRMSQTSMKAAYMPDGSLGVGLYDKAGNFKGYADNAVVPPGYLEKIHHGQEFKVDADGTLQSIPTTSTSQPLVPPSPAQQKPNQLLQGPQPPNPANLKSILTQGAAQAGQVAANPPVTPAGAKAALQNGAKGGVNAKPVMSGGQPFQTAGGPMSDEAMHQAAEKYYSTGQLPPGGRGAVGMAQNRAIMNLAAQLHPGGNLAANSAEFKANQQSLVKLQSNFDQVTAFENTAGKNLDLFLQTAKPIIDSGSPIINSPVRLASKALTGSENQAAFDAARTTALTEIAKVLNSSNASGVLSDSARHEVEGLIGPNATLKQIYAAANVLKQDMANRHQAYQDQIGDIKHRMGPQSSAAPGHIISVNGQRYQYKGSGATDDMNSYTQMK